jgi:hypothetical protein
VQKFTPTAIHDCIAKYMRRTFREMCLSSAPAAMPTVLKDAPAPRVADASCACTQARLDKMSPDDLYFYMARLAAAPGPAGAKPWPLGLADPLASDLANCLIPYVGSTASPAESLKPMGGARRSRRRACRRLGLIAIRRRMCAPWPRRIRSARDNLTHSRRAV